MKRNACATLLFLTFAMCGFAPDDSRDASCYLNLRSAAGLKAGEAQRRPEGAEKVRRLPTADGTVAVSSVDGYRLLYNNRKGAPFVNMKVEFSEPEKYGEDTLSLLANLRYLNSVSAGMETPDLIRLSYNGYTIHGLSRASIDSGRIIGSFVMFPGNNITVYFDVHNLKPEYRHYNSVAEYKGLRNAFFGEYTAHLAGCKKR